MHASKDHDQPTFQWLTEAYCSPRAQCYNLPSPNCICKIWHFGTVCCTAQLAGRWGLENMRMLKVQLLPDHSIGKPSLADGGAVISQLCAWGCSHQAFLYGGEAT